MDDDEARRLLSAERSRVEDALAGLDASGREGLDDPVEDQGDPNLLDAANRDGELRGQLEEELAGIERAEQRLADGRYGVSIESGEPIPDARLRAQPTAERTVDEQQRSGG